MVAVLVDKILLLGVFTIFFLDLDLGRVFLDDVFELHGIRAVSRQIQIEVRAGHIYVYYLYKCRLQPLNLFGGRIAGDDEDADSQEIEFVPAWIQLRK